MLPCSTNPEILFIPNQCAIAVRLTSFRSLTLLPFFLKLLPDAINQRVKGLLKSFPRPRDPVPVKLLEPGSGSGSGSRPAAFALFSCTFPARRPLHTITHTQYTARTVNAKQRCSALSLRSRQVGHRTMVQSSHCDEAESCRRARVSGTGDLHNITTNAQNFFNKQQLLLLHHIHRNT